MFIQTCLQLKTFILAPEYHMHFSSKHLRIINEDPGQVTCIFQLRFMSMTDFPSNLIKGLFLRLLKGSFSLFSQEPRLYKRVCPSIGRSVGWYVGQSVVRRSVMLLSLPVPYFASSPSNFLSFVHLPFSNLPHT